MSIFSRIFSAVKGFADSLFTSMSPKPTEPIRQRRPRKPKPTKEQKAAARQRTAVFIRSQFEKRAEKKRERSAKAKAAALRVPPEVRKARALRASRAASELRHIYRASKGVLPNSALKDWYTTAMKNPPRSKARKESLRSLFANIEKSEHEKLRAIFGSPGDMIYAEAA